VQPALNLIIADISATAVVFLGMTVCQVLLQRDEGSYQLPHIYDYLLSIAATPGKQSFRKRQQRLPKCQK